MKLRHLKCFMVLSEELHFSKAAEKLYIGQPPLSRTIKELENELGVKLFDRNKRNVKLTPCGEFLKAEGSKLFSNIENIKTQLKIIDEGKSGQLKIGYVGAAMHSILPDLLINLREKMDITTILYEMNNDDQIQAIKSEQIDIGFLRSAPHTNELSIIPILKETFSLILPLNHPLANHKKINIKDLAKEPFISLNYQCAPALIDKIMNICLQKGFAPKIAHETSQINSIIRLVESGLGYSIVPTSVKTVYSLNVKFIEINSVKEKAELLLLHLKNMSPLVQNCINIILEDEY